MTRQRWLPVAGLVPCVILFWANVQFAWNYFVDRPHIHDIGWYSAIVWRSGFVPDNPPAAHYLRSYWDVHVSLLVSAASLVSYLVPLDRVHWYCLFQGLIYAPLGAMVVLLIGRAGERAHLRDALLLGGIALLFAFNGQVVSCMVFPHFEVFAAVGICTMLAAIATGRARLAWVGLALAASTREDGGFHAAFFLAAVLASDLTKRSFPLARRSIVVMFLVALGASVVAFGVQRLFFEPSHLFRDEYLGEPTYGHLSAAVIAQRILVLGERAPFLVMPFAVTLAVAVWKRDARWLLGWAAELPWLVLNFLAKQEHKSWFASYTGFPFVASLFWVGAYARAMEKAPERRSWLMPLAAVAASSMLGIAFTRLWEMDGFVARAFLPTATPSTDLQDFARDLERDPAAFGALWVDPGIASWTTSSMTGREMRYDPDGIESFEGKSGMAFYANGAWQRGVPDLLRRAPFPVCGRLPRTRVFFCAREGRTLPPRFVPANPLAVETQ